MQAATTDFSKTRAFFHVPEGLTYLDGNSLGPLPRKLPDALDGMLKDQWGEMLIGAWSKAGWMDRPERTGDRIADLIGASRGTVTVGDTLSVKVYQALGSALALRPKRKIVLTDTGNFPSDLYIAQGLLRTIGSGHQLKCVPPEDIESHIDHDVAVLMLTEVDYRTSRRHNMIRLSELARRHGVLTVWDLAHSAGAKRVQVEDANADFAVGCTYKFLNGGPGAPAFIYVSKDIVESVLSPLTGWLGHAAPFKFSPTFEPSPGIGRMRVGTPPIVGLVALDAALDVWDFASISDVEMRADELSEAFIAAVEQRCPELDLASPRDPAKRGSQVSLRHPEGYAIMQTLIENRVVGDFREPDIMRFGIAPLYNSQQCMDTAVDQLVKALESKPWESGKYRTKAAIT